MRKSISILIGVLTTLLTVTLVVSPVEAVKKGPSSLSDFLACVNNDGIYGIGTDYLYCCTADPKTRKDHCILCLFGETEDGDKILADACETRDYERVITGLPDRAFPDLQIKPNVERLPKQIEPHQ